MSIEVFRMKRFLVDRRMEGQKESVLPSVREEQMGKELFSEMLTPT